MSFWIKKRVASEMPEQGRHEVHLNFSSTGRVWVDPKQVVRTDAFQRQREAVKRLREAKEKTSLASA